MTTSLDRALTDRFALQHDELPVADFADVRRRARRLSASRKSVRWGAWQTKLVLAAVVVVLGAAGTSLAIAGTGWLVGSPAPANVRSDYGSYATQLGFDPRPGKAVLVASDGDYQLYATADKQGGICTLVSAPWRRPGANGEGGDCTANDPDATPFWAGIGGAAGNDPTTLVLYGHTTDKAAVTVRFDAPNGRSISAPVGAGGFFIVGTTIPGSYCDWGAWTPQFDVLNRDGQRLSTTSVTLIPHPRRVTIPGRGQACIATEIGPYGASSGQLPIGG
jgi:hypothetical protein